MTKPETIVYGTLDRPPVRISLLQALQQMAFLGVYMVVVSLFARTMGLNHNDSLHLISATLLASGIGVIIQAARFGGLGSGYFCPVQATSSTFAALTIARASDGMAAMFGMVAIIGLSQMVFAFLFKSFRQVFTVQVAGVSVMLIGLGLGYNGVKLIVIDNPGSLLNENQSFLLFALTLFTMIFFNVWFKGYLRMFSAFLGLAVGFTGTYLLGGIPPMGWQAFQGSPLFYLPEPLYFGWKINADIFIPAIITGMFLALHGVGALLAAQRFNDADWKRPDLEMVRRGVMAEGMTNLLNSFLNGLPLTSSGGAVSLAAATGCTSRWLAYWLGTFMILLAFMPKFIVFWDIMPQPVMGAALIFLSAFTVLAGLQVIASRLLDNRKILTVGIALVLGFSFEPLRPQLMETFPDVIRDMVFSGVGVGVLAAVLLSLIFRVRNHTRDRRAFIASSDSLDDVAAFIRIQGQKWGARPEAVGRAEYAAKQAFEIIAEHALSDSTQKSRAIELQTLYDEFTFIVIFYYHGMSIPVSLQAPSHEEMLHEEDGVARMAGYLLHRLADHVRSRGGERVSELRLIFND